MIDNHKNKQSNSILFIVIGLFTTLVLSGCDNKNELSKPCDPLPIVDGYKIIKVKKGNFTLKLPDYADVRRQRGEDRGCEYVRDLFVHYLWYEDKLLSEGKNRLKVPYAQTVKVNIFFKGSGFVDAASERYRNDPVEIERPWRFDDALAHKKFPLEFYPKAAWDDPENPSEIALKRARLDSVWGIKHTKYRNPINGRLFMGACSIAPLDKDKPSSSINNITSRTGAFSCRGYITAASGGRYLSFMVDTHTHRNNGQSGMMEINLIYDAVVEKIQSFIQE